MTATTPKKPTLRFKTFEGGRELRKKLGMNQSEFRSKLGVTQPGDSRYESGRNIPPPLLPLLQQLQLAYGTEKQAADLLAWLRGAER